MRTIDWFILISSLIFIVLYGLWKGRGNKDIQGYLLADRNMRWFPILLSIMATQASAITFLSVPGQAYVDGIRFVQFYLGLPLAMIILSITVVPIFHRLKIYTAYEFLENRFDVKTRTLGAMLFMTQRGLAAGLTIYAPSLILSILLDWNLHWTNFFIGSLVIIYTTAGGTKAVNWTHFQQMLIITIGMFTAFFLIIKLLPADISFLQAVQLSGKLGKLNAIDFSFDLTNRYTFWSGIIGGLFLQLSYFGTDQSQVQRYLTGKSVAHSRMALLFNGIVKVPMQFSILFLGAILFIFYQFNTPPIFFNSVATSQVKKSNYSAQFSQLEDQYRLISEKKAEAVRELAESFNSRNNEQESEKKQQVQALQDQAQEVRRNAIELIRRNDPDVDPSDTNYIFLSYVIHYLPAGIVGLILAVIFAASMSSTASELNALASTTVVDIYKRLLRQKSSDRHYLLVSKMATLGWGLYAILMAEVASRLGSLIEAVNIVGSVFYGTILGIFLVGFYFKSIKGSSTFYAAILAELLVLYCFYFTEITFLWYNVIGCLGVIIFSFILRYFFRNQKLSTNIASAE
ncbi:MAG: sodium:solute symporter [Caldithrix sp. RBG_13_44_9]|nr:MAG: sodium:solute symporter [Caldithrix sp. RBG_13_44_9]